MTISLRRAEAVETIGVIGVIRPLRIAEIGRAACEHVGLNGLPHWAGKIGAGLHNDDQFADAGDVEPELMILHAEARTAGLCLRVPCRPAIKQRAPTGGARLVIDSSRVIPCENRCIIGWRWRVAIKINPGEAGTVSEGITSNNAYAAGNGKAGQGTHIGKRSVPYAGDGAGERHAAQLRINERLTSDRGDAGRNRVTSMCPTGKLNHHVLAFVQQ